MVSQISETSYSSTLLISVLVFPIPSFIYDLLKAIVSTPSKWFSKFLRKNNLKPITFHQLRHTSASLLINENINIREISKRLGHSNTSTTLNIYSHALKSADKDAADKLNTIIFSNDSINNKD
ncbi:site-specific integrase [Clostridium felsineum]|uniref:site-specific integrase n=1 Tax=Clostridium felsineum TaxID=36839 RepID=UPI00098C081A|nr:site-specific integrase [Clostridium felsineum]URZ14082.1 Tyrosine recombinase XerC [Clostridium felsineum DSM 794]